MPKKMRITEGEEVPLAPEVSAPPVVERGYSGPPLGQSSEPIRTLSLTGSSYSDMSGGERHPGYKEPLTYAPLEEPPLPELGGHGITRKLTPTGFVAYRVTTGGAVEVLTPKRNGQLDGESKDGAAARALEAFRAAVMGAG